MVAGGFAIAGSRIAEIDSQIADLRESVGIKSEFHWSEYRGGNRRKAYEALVDYAFSLISEKKAELHVIIAKFEGYNHRGNGGDDRDTSVNRMYYQLLLHRVARFYGKTRLIHARLDAGNDCADICQMRGQLCAAAYKIHKTAPNCIRSIEAVCSKNSGVIQMADVIVGAIAAKRNQVPHVSPKGALADYVLSASGFKTWAASTTITARGINIWQHVGKN